MRTESSNGNVRQKRIGNGGRLQRRVLVNDCRHSERCKFFVVAYILHIYDPREGGRGKVGSLATVRIGESFSIYTNACQTCHIIAYENQILNLSVSPF